jgi:hypothetical protein
MEHRDVTGELGRGRAVGSGEAFPVESQLRFASLVIVTKKEQFCWSLWYDGVEQRFVPSFIITGFWRKCYLGP